MRVLESYVAGAWYAPDRADAELTSAIDGSPVAGVSTAGIDFGAVVDHARHVGGPALRRFTFRQRAGLLKELAGVVAANKDELYRLSALTGATSTDAWVDVDGGIGVLAVYASKGKRGLPEGHVLVDGDVERLSRDGTFIGQHILVPRDGVAVQINAFNFPCWGLLEKLAPAILAGAPVIAKPASPTAFVAEALVRHLVASEVLPDGALQLISGSAGDLLDHLGGQDSVGFTGSASTAALLRGHPAVTDRSLRFTAEADSLNSCILAGDSAEEVERFVAEVTSELTIKTGQRCTAIRKAIVPATQLDRVADALRRRIAEIRIGDPTDEATGMGPVVNRDQLADVQSAVQRLTADGGCEIAIRDEDAIAAAHDGGAYMPVTVLVQTGAAGAVDDVEAFGPVTTLVPYDDLDEAVAIARRGGGSLVSSVVADDRTAADRLVVGLAPYHGRVLVLDRVAAKRSTGHGSPMPHLVHGGPGRAGGGEELGGLRAVHHHLQRTALQGSPDLVTTVTSRFAPGSTRREVDEHPFRRHFEDLTPGDTLFTDERAVTLEDIVAFADLTGDRFYAHMDQEAAAANPLFEGRVAHGYLVLSLVAGLFVWPDPGPVLANIGLRDLRFEQPVYPGDRIRAALTCKALASRGSAPYGEVTWDVEATNQGGEVVAAYDLLTLVARQEGSRDGPGEGTAG